MLTEQKKDIEQDVMSVGEAARLLKRHPVTIRGWVANGDLKGKMQVYTPPSIIPPRSRYYVNIKDAVRLTKTFGITIPDKYKEYE